MTLIKRMDEVIDKLESNDEAFIETLNKEFEKYCETKDVKEKTLKPKYTWQRHAIPAVGKNCRCDAVWMRMRLG